MSFCQEWNKVYAKEEHLSIWPWSDLISYVMKYARPSGRNFRVLELGCGAGANIAFFQHLGVDYYTVEGSSFMFRKLKEKYPALKEKIVCADFTLSIPFSGKFDLVVDRSSLAHNTTSAIRHCLDEVHNKLKVNGKFIGVGWFSQKCSDYKKGREVKGDIYSKTGFKDGPFAHIGIVHFSDRAHLLGLFKKFEFTVLEHTMRKMEIPEDNHIFAFWNFVAVKK